jgi:hypothetical protein
MKKLLSLAAVAAIAMSVRAQDVDSFDETEEEVIPQMTETQRKKVAAWPVFFALCNVPETPDLIGLRLTLPFSTKQDSVTGFDIGFWGRCKYFEGLQLNILRNDVKDQLSGFQVGLYNSAAQADMFGAQVGLWNECGDLDGVQAGLVNSVGAMRGVQLGLVNRAEQLYGLQVGVINVIRDAEIRFCPVVNIGF